MDIKRILLCAFLFYICYLIVTYLDNKTEGFGRGGGGGGRGGGRGGGIGRGGGVGRGGHYGGRGGYYGGRGRYYGGYYGGGPSYPIVINDDYYPSYLYPSYWYRYIPFIGYY